MSQFSGKCDFYDHIMIHGLDKTLSSRIYIGENIVPLRIDSEKDCVPYYPYLVSLSVTENGIGTIRLTTKSFIDTEEQKRLKIYLAQILRMYNHYKRKQTIFNKEEVLSSISLFTPPEQWLVLLVDRVAEQGQKATIAGLHTDIHNYYRKLLYDEMLKHGYSPDNAHYWVYHEFVHKDGFYAF